jgi:hypothetical protein
MSLVNTCQWKQQSFYVLQKICKDHPQETLPVESIATEGQEGSENLMHQLLDQINDGNIHDTNDWCYFRETTHKPCTMILLRNTEIDIV